MSRRECRLAETTADITRALAPPNKCSNRRWLRDAPEARGSVLLSDQGPHHIGIHPLHRRGMFSTIEVSDSGRHTTRPLHIAQSDAELVQQPQAKVRDAGQSHAASRAVKLCP